MTDVQIYGAIEPWIYFLGSALFLVILGASTSANKQHPLKAAFIFLVATQAVAYSIWTIQYLMDITPLVSFIGTWLDLCSPILIFVVLFYPTSELKGLKKKK